MTTDRGGVVALEGTGSHAERARVLTEPRRRGPYERVAKPVFDRALALVLIVVLIPVLAVVGLAVLIRLGRPVLYRQERVGRHGKVFKLNRFRTNDLTADDAGSPVDAGESETVLALSRLGRGLRATGLDELPQLWNVVVGQMSLVGPRPERLEVVRAYELWQHRRHQVKPGITGLWQVIARGDGRHMHEHTEIDLDYVDRLSLLTDLRILARTLPAVLRRRERPTVIPGVIDTPILARRTWGEMGYLATKRIVDIVVSLVGIIVLMPAFAAIAVAIKVDSDGTVLFRQVRVGYRGQLFRMLKLRTMPGDADEVVHLEHYRQLARTSDSRTAAPIRLHDDVRVTRVGRFLRRWSLDELPNLWNVLRGEMSLVGPRPFVPYEVDLHDPVELRRLEARPGITGYAQVVGRSDVSLAERARLDLRYLEERSAWLDSKLLALTLLTVIRQPGD